MLLLLENALKNIPNVILSRLKKLNHQNIDWNYYCPVYR